MRKTENRPLSFGVPDPFHTIDHFHIDRRINGTSGGWKKTYTGTMEMLRQ